MPEVVVGVELAALGAMTLLGVAFPRAERSVRRWEGAALLSGFAAFLALLPLDPGRG